MAGMLFPPTEYERALMDVRRLARLACDYPEIEDPENGGFLYFTELTAILDGLARPTPTDDAAFLTRILAAAQASEPVTAEDVARLRQLADWADAAPPVGWNGTINKHEVARAVEAARKGMRDE